MITSNARPIPYSIPSRLKIRAKYLARLVWTRRAHTWECYVATSLLTIWLRARSSCQKQPCKADTTSTTYLRGENGYFSSPLEKLHPTRSSTRDPAPTERERARERERERERKCVAFELRPRSWTRKAWKRAGQPCVFTFLRVVWSNVYRRFSFTLTRLPIVTIGPYLNTRRPY